MNKRNEIVRLRISKLKGKNILPCVEHFIWKKNYGVPNFFRKIYYIPDIPYLYRSIIPTYW